GVRRTASREARAGRQESQVRPLRQGHLRSRHADRGIMTEQPNVISSPSPPREQGSPAQEAPLLALRAQGIGLPIVTALLLTAGIFACSIWANLAFAITNPDSHRFIPPFKSGVNVNANKHLGGEYYDIAQSLVVGEGFAHPFDQPTGPTAWQAPVLPAILA